MLCFAPGTSSPAQSCQQCGRSWSKAARPTQRHTEETCGWTWDLFCAFLGLEYMAVSCSVPIPPPNRGSRGEAPTCILKVGIKYTYQLTSAVATRTTLPLKLSSKDICCIYLLRPFLGSIWMLFNLFSSFNLAKKILWPHDMELDRTLHCHRGPLCCERHTTETWREWLA